MPRLIKSARAERELINLWNYIEEHSGESRANAVLRKINQKIAAIATQPGIGRPRDELAPGLRSLPAPPYVIFYFPIEGGIEVIHVIHGRQDIDAIFEEEGEDDEL